VIGKTPRQPPLTLLFSSLCLVFGALGFWLLAADPAAAHPHVWVTAREEVLFNEQGEIRAVRSAWVFDEMYSAFATEGLGKDGKPATPEELAPLAKTNVESLAEFDYFVFAKNGGAKIAFDPPVDYHLEERADKRVVLHFTLPLKAPVKASKAFSLQVYDPTYFVAFSLEKDNPVSLVAAPSGCSANVLGANPLVADETKKLSEAFFSGLSPGSDFGMKLADRAIVACP